MANDQLCAHVAIRGLIFMDAVSRPAKKWQQYPGPDICFERPGYVGVLLQCYV